MSLAAPTTPFLRLVRDDDDTATAAPVDVEMIQRQLADARDEAAGLRRRVGVLGEQMARLDGELRLAGRLQRQFLPRALPRVGPATFTALLRPAGHVSGDFYDVLRLDEHHVGFYVADAVGHGVPAALLTMFVRHALTTKAIDPAGGGYRLLSPGETLSLLNAALLDRDLSADTFATAAYGVVDCRTRTVTLARAGHPYPARLAADGTVTMVDCDGGLLGIIPDEVYGTATFRLAPGERLLLYTDGVEAAFAEDARDSVAAWRRLLAAGGSTDDLFNRVADAVVAFNGDAPPRDDLTLLAVDLDG